MPKTLKEQIAAKCVHFNGVMNECCKAGVKYADVRVGKPYLFPCIKTGGQCSKASFLTDEEVEKRESEILHIGDKSLTAYVKIKEHYATTKDNPGRVACECGGVIKYAVAETNGHIWAKCDTCGLSFNE